MPEPRAFAGSLKPGAKVGKYEIREQVGTGGMAVLYKAHDPMLDRFVAVKQIAPHLAQDERFVERFRTEAQTLAKLSSSQANIVSVYEMIQQDGQLFLVMEYVEGTTLRTLMDRGPIPLQTALGVLLSTALGLKAMHSQGIVHRDLTPANIMMAKDGALKITDFGLIGHSGGKTSLPMGTTKYMAPEMFTGIPVDARADLYSLGMIAYEMLVGPEKFAEAFKDVLRDEKAQQVRWMHWHSNPTMKPPPLRDLQPGIPPLVAKIVDRMMDKDPTKRFPSSEQIIRWLRRIFVMHVQGRSISASDSESMEKEIEAEGAAPVAAASAAVPAARPGQPLPARAPGAAAIEGPGEKTAPLPQPKWTWKQATIVAAIVVGVCGSVLTVFLVRDHYNRMRWEDAANQVWQLGMQQYDNKEYGEAYKTFMRMAADFGRELRMRAEQAQIYAQMSKAEDALAKKDYEVADSACGAAEKLGATNLWVNDFRTRLLKYQDIEQVLKAAELAQQAGDFQKAKTLLEGLAQKNTELNLNDQIIRLSEKIELREYTRLMDLGKERFGKGSLSTAQEALLAAQKIRDTPEVSDLLRKVRTKAQVDQLMSALNIAWQARKWADVQIIGPRILALEPNNPDIRRRVMEASVAELRTAAQAFEQNNLSAQALPLWIKILQILPTDPEALQYVQKADRQKRVDSTLKEAMAAMGTKKWDEAIRGFGEVLKLLTAPTDTAQKTKIEGHITECSFQKAMEAARAAFDRDDFDEAERQAAIAAGFKQNNDDAKTLQANIDTGRKYKVLFDTAKELYKDLSFGKARDMVIRALKVKETAEARALLVDIDYHRYLAQTKMYRDQGKIQEALSVSEMCRKVKDTPEIQAIQDLLRRALEGQKPKEEVTKE